MTVSRFSAHYDVGIVGTEETIEGVRRWFEKCRGGIAAKESRLSNLFPAFPGFSEDASFHASLLFHDRWCSAIRQREIDAVLAHSEGDDTIRQAVRIFLDRAEELVQ